MKKQEYKELTNQVMDAVKKAMADDEEQKELFAECLEAEFRELPKHKETVRTLRGIYGFLRFCDDNKTPRSQFVFNAVHDISECVRNYTEKWYSPRLSRYADYTPKNETILNY